MTKEFTRKEILGLGGGMAAAAVLGPSFIDSLSTTSASLVLSKERSLVGLNLTGQTIDGRLRIFRPVVDVARIIGDDFMEYYVGTAGTEGLSSKIIGLYGAASFKDNSGRFVSVGNEGIVEATALQKRLEISAREARTIGYCVANQIVFLTGRSDHGWMQAEITRPIEGGEWVTQEIMYRAGGEAGLVANERNWKSRRGDRVNGVSRLKFTLG